MLSSKLLLNLPRTRHILPVVSTAIRKCSNKPKEKDEQTNLGKMGAKYQVFRDEDSVEILDIYEERNKYAQFLEEDHQDNSEENIFQGLNLQRGIHGVFDIEDLVQVLQRENSEDIFVVSVLPEVKYVDYICIVSAKSVKHMQAIAQFVRKVYKQKRLDSDKVPKLEGANSKDWMALDLGNIALHIFSREARVLYDLDSLWALGSKYDNESNKQDAVTDMLERHSVYLNDLKPAT